MRVNEAFPGVGVGGRVIVLVFSFVVWSGLLYLLLFYLSVVGEVGVGINSWVGGQWALWEGLLVGFISWIAGWMGGWVVLRMGGQAGLGFLGIRIDVSVNYTNPYRRPAALCDGLYGCFIIPSRLG